MSLLSSLCCVGLAIAVVAVPSAVADGPETTIRVGVGDVGSNAPRGCGKGAALAGGFVNEFDHETSKLFLFGFNATGAAAGSPWRSRSSPCRAGLRLREAVVPIAPSATATATVTCPRGTEAVSGGFSDQNAGTNGSLVFGFRSKRIGMRRWRASAINKSDSVSSRLIVQANCDPARPGLRQRATTVEVPGGTTRSTRIRCAGRRRAWSAGFETKVQPDGAGAFPYVLRRFGHRSWRAAAFGEGDGGDFTVDVLCGGAGERPTASGPPSSPAIAYSFDGHIEAIRPDGSGRRRLSGDRGAADVQPAWSPDGARLAFVRSRASGDHAQIYLTGADGGTPTPLMAPGRFWVSDPAWSPDGRWIAFARRAIDDEESAGEIVVAEAGGGEERVVWSEPPGERIAGVAQPAWSPDGSRIAFTRAGLDRDHHFRSALHVIDATGGTPQLLADDAGDAAWSPDGARIAFASTRDRNGEWCGSDECSWNDELYVMDADGSDPVRLTRSRGDDRSPSWSPDGRRIAFASNRNNRGDPPGLDTEIYSIGADGSCLTWLTNGAPASRDPAWRGTSSGSSHPGRCGATRRPPRTEVDLAGLRSSGSVFWLGERYRNLLLGHVEGSLNGRSRRSWFLAYDDCASFRARDCGRELRLQATSVCSRLSPLRGLAQPLPQRLRRSFAERGLLLVGLGRAGVSVIAGHASVKIFAWSGPGRIRPQLIAAGRALRSVRAPRARPPAPALPRTLLRTLRRSQRLLARAGSLDAAARAMGVSPQRMRRRIELARTVRSLPRVRAISCARR